MFLSALVLAAALAPQDVHYPSCTADIRWANPTEMTASRAAGRPLTLFIGTATESRCRLSELRVSAIYLDGNGEVVCSGTVGDISFRHRPTAVINLEVRPGNLYEFLRWRNGPREVGIRWKPLECQNADGTATVQPAEIERATSLRLYATVHPAFGIATAEMRMTLVP